MRFRPRSLRQRVALATALAAAGASAGVIVGLLAFYRLEGALHLRRLEPATEAALKSLDLETTIATGRLAESNASVGAVPSPAAEPLVLLGVGLSGLALGAAAGLAIGRRVVRPIESVSRAAAAIAAGDFDARADPEAAGDDETAALMRNFNRMADHLDKVEGELAESAAAIAHELRTPVTVLRARLQAMHDGLFAPTEREISGLIAQTDLLATIIDNLRVLSLAGSERLELQSRATDLALEAVRVLDAFERSLREHGLEVRRRLRPALAMADPDRVRQVLAALLDNTRLHAREGGVVEVETRTESGLVLLSVADRGPGLPADGLASAFDRFWRAEPSRTRHAGGSGLGLAVVRAIAEAHGGRAWAANRASGGLVVSVALPAVQANQGDGASSRRCGAVDVDLQRFR